MVPSCEKARAGSVSDMSPKFNDRTAQRQQPLSYISCEQRCLLLRSSNLESRDRYLRDALSRNADLSLMQVPREGRMTDLCIVYWPDCPGS